MRVLGLDIGDKRIGVAMSDPLGILASSRNVIQRNGESGGLDEIAALVNEFDVTTIVAGLPKLMDGTMGTQADKSTWFAHQLSEVTGVEVIMWDERLSSVAAERMLRDSGTKPQNIKGEKDSAAAALILQGYLDSHRDESMELL